MRYSLISSCDEQLEAMLRYINETNANRISISWVEESTHKMQSISFTKKQIEKELQRRSIRKQNIKKLFNL